MRSWARAAVLEPTHALSRLAPSDGDRHHRHRYAAGHDRSQRIFQRRLRAGLRSRRGARIQDAKMRHSGHTRAKCDPNPRPIAITALKWAFRRYRIITPCNTRNHAVAL